MSSTYIRVAVITLVLFPFSAGAATTRHTGAIVVLPIEQADIGARSQLKNRLLSNAVLTRLSALADVELVEFDELMRTLDDRLVDDAVFELLVTDDLKYTLANLNAMETKTAKTAEYCKVARDLGIDHLIEVAIEPGRRHLQITYKIISTQAARVVFAKSFYEVPNDPIGVANEIAKRVIRSLWRQNPTHAVRQNRSMAPTSS